jgi:hypothetical protein
MSKPIESPAAAQNLQTDTDVKSNAGNLTAQNCAMNEGVNSLTPDVSNADTGNAANTERIFPPGTATIDGVSTNDPAATLPLREVKTVLSQQSVNAIENITYDFWNNFDGDCFTKKIMLMLSVYIKRCPDNVHALDKPDCMAEFVSEYIQLIAQLRDIMNDERPWNWVDTVNGWRLPMPSNQSKTDAV